jgi:3-methylcrotonyl-CoA carboxylase alpha subunit
VNKILIANRGEIACRIIRTCRELGIGTVAVHSDADANALHVALADEAVPIGAAAPAQSYLRGGRIIEAARSTGADAIHPGYGFLSENASFARVVEAAEITWIGPDPASIDAMGDKARARELAADAGVPVLPGSPRFACTEPAATMEHAAAEVGYPLLVKAVSGGGGIGMRAVSEPRALHDAIERAQSVAQRAFGDGTIYFERFVPEARHVEVQVFGLGDAGALHLFERDCSLQRRFQKVIEESPAPGISSLTLEAMYGCALELCRKQRYRGAGTVEFIVDAHTERFYFLEMNTRIQVEHPVTEMVTGLDLVAMQIEHAAGRPLAVSQPTIRRGGHAIECRLYAERPAKGFLPSPGVLRTLRFPSTDGGVRIETGVREGDTITHHYDPMIAKVVAHGADRARAAATMLAALADIRIEGVETNLGFLRRTIAHRVFQSGCARTHSIDRYREELVADAA